ncbi:hypothetical protein [Wolbachia endosymbiont (group A) of Trypoxylon clavicerum]|nr:hypothetical protein [Wolbachia endosymbiont (group A) of Trypoxylon clavicerum]
MASLKFCPQSLANNVDVNTIVKFTGLSISEIEELSVSGYK